MIFFKSTKKIFDKQYFLFYSKDRSFVFVFTICFEKRSQYKNFFVVDFCNARDGRIYMKENTNEDRINWNELEKAAEYTIGGSRKDFSDYNLCQVFKWVPYGLPFVLDDAIECVKRHCPQDEKISFKPLFEFNRFTSIEVCDLKTLFNCISEYVEQNSNNLDYITDKETWEMNFFAYWYRYIRSDEKPLDAEN